MLFSCGGILFEIRTSVITKLRGFETYIGIFRLSIKIAQFRYHLIAYMLAESFIIGELLVGLFRS
jgi:hypothetical protein